MSEYNINDLFDGSVPESFGPPKFGNNTGSQNSFTEGVATSVLHGNLPTQNQNIGDKKWTQSCVFSVSSATIVSWAAGTLTTADGVSYSIAASNTGVMSAKNYIYLDTNISKTAYQVTTTARTAIGVGKLLIAVAQNGTNEATFTVLDSQGGQNIDASQIVANSITANELASALVYAGILTIDTAGNIHSGQTTYDNGTGWFIGDSGGVAKFSIGESTGDKMTWDGDSLRVKGNIELSSPINMVSYTVANLPIAPASVGFSSPSAYE